MQEILDIFETNILENDLVVKLSDMSVTALQYLKFVGILVLGILLLSSLSRFLFGKKAQLTQAISASIEIFFVYVLSAAIFSLGLKLQEFLTPLPFVVFADEYMVVFPLLEADFPSICDQAAQLLIIAFLVNLISGLMPKGKHIITWFILRLLVVAVSVGLIYAVDLLMNQYVPREIMENGPMILLIALAALILLGSLKVLVGGAIAFLDPIMAALYTFFFANFIGRALAKAIVTSALIIGLVAALNALEIYAVHIAPSVLTAYIPLLLVILLLWYVVGLIFTKEE